MRVLALISGGKDSCYSILQCMAAGHEIVALGNIKPTAGIDEMDSYMYQTVGHEIIDLYAEAMGLPLFRRETQAKTLNAEVTYEMTSSDEVEDLHHLLETAKNEIEIEAVSSGAILSNYQRVRVENVCSRLGLVSLAYLWRRDQKELMAEMIAANIKAIVVKTASFGLEPKKVLGVDISDLFEYFTEISEKYQLNVCGEGGEFETVTLDCPVFKKRIEILEKEIVWVVRDEIAPVAYLKIKKARLVDKIGSELEFDVEKWKKPLDFVSEFDSGSHRTKSEVCDVIETPFLNLDSIEPHFRITQQNIWVSGLVGKGDSIRSSTERIMDEISRILRENSLTMRNLIKINVYIASMSEYADFNDVYKRYFTVNPPVRACVQVRLPPGVFFLMDCLGIVKRDKESMHVQSVSNWAPANIGPYSQGVLTGSLIFTSGQIALIPGTMTPINARASVQSELVLRHIERVLRAMRSGVGLDHVIAAVCFTTDSEFFGGKFEPVLISAQVSGLPRNADVEWQVVAKIDADEELLAENMSEFQDGGVHLTVCDGFGVLKYFCDGDLSLDEVKGGFERINKEIEVGYAQVYSCDGKIEFCEFVKDFFDCAMSVVPVIRFERIDCKLIVFLHGIKKNK